MTKQYLYFSEITGKINVRYIENGKRRAETIKGFRPDIFVPSKNENSKYKNIYGQPLDKVDVGDIWDVRNFVKEYKDIENYQLYGYSKFANQYVHKNFSSEWNADNIRIAYFDIETEVPERGFPKAEEAAQPIYVLTFVLSDEDKPIVFCLEHDDLNVSKLEHVDLRLYKDESTMLRNVISFFRESELDVLTGWNCQLFDIPYLVNRINRVCGDKVVNELSPFGRVYNKDVQKRWGKQTVHFIDGISCLDFLEIYQKFELTPRENYQLETIAQVDLGKGKIKHHSGIPGHLLYKEGFYTDAILYNIEDTTLLKELEEKKKLFQLSFAIAYMTKTNFHEVVSSMPLWENYIYISLDEERTYFEWNRTRRPSRPFEGALVKEPIPGRYKWIVSFDVDAMYPSIMIGLNMSPETIIDDLRFDYTSDDLFHKRVDWKDAKEKDYSFAANGATFRRDIQGFIPRLLARVMKERNSDKELSKKYKKEGNDELADIYDLWQKAKKVFSNGLYGISGAEHWKFYDVRLSEGTTSTGRAMIQWIVRDMNTVLNKLLGTTDEDFWIASDTDSLVGDTKILVDGNEITMEEFFENLPNEYMKNQKDNQIKKISTDMLSPSLSKTLKVENKKILYAMRHKVKKKMYKISVGGSSVTVTSDHSVVILRNGCLVDCSPEQIKKGDKIVKLK